MRYQLESDQMAFDAYQESWWDTWKREGLFSPIIISYTTAMTLNYHRSSNSYSLLFEDDRNQRETFDTYMKRNKTQCDLVESIGKELDSLFAASSKVRESEKVILKHIEEISRMKDKVILAGLSDQTKNDFLAHVYYCIYQVVRWFSVRQVSRHDYAKSEKFLRTYIAKFNSEFGNVRDLPLLRAMKSSLILLRDKINAAKSKARNKKLSPKEIENLWQYFFQSEPLKVQDTKQDAKATTSKTHIVQAQPDSPYGEVPLSPSKPDSPYNKVPLSPSKPDSPYNEVPLSPSKPDSLYDTLSDLFSPQTENEVSSDDSSSTSTEEDEALKESRKICDDPVTLLKRLNNEWTLDQETRKFIIDNVLVGKGISKDMSIEDRFSEARQKLWQACVTVLKTLSNKTGLSEEARKKQESIYLQDTMSDFKRLTDSLIKLSPNNVTEDMLKSHRNRIDKFAQLVWDSGVNDEARLNINRSYDSQIKEIAALQARFAPETRQKAVKEEKSVNIERAKETAAPAASVVQPMQAAGIPPSNIQILGGKHQFQVYFVQGENEQTLQQEFDNEDDNFHNYLRVSVKPETVSPKTMSWIHREIFEGLKRQVKRVQDANLSLKTSADFYFGRIKAAFQIALQYLEIVKLNIEPDCIHMHREFLDTIGDYATIVGKRFTLRQSIEIGSLLAAQNNLLRSRATSLTAKTSNVQIDSPVKKGSYIQGLPPPRKVEEAAKGKLADPMQAKNDIEREIARQREMIKSRMIEIALKDACMSPDAFSDINASSEIRVEPDKEKSDAGYTRIQKRLDDLRKKIEKEEEEEEKEKISRQREVGHKQALARINKILVRSDIPLNDKLKEALAYIWDQLLSSGMTDLPSSFSAAETQNEIIQYLKNTLEQYNQVSNYMCQQDIVTEEMLMQHLNILDVFVSTSWCKQLPRVMHYTVVSKKQKQEKSILSKLDAIKAISVAKEEIYESKWSSWQDCIHKTSDKTREKISELLQTEDRSLLDRLHDARTHIKESFFKILQDIPTEYQSTKKHTVEIILVKEVLKQYQYCLEHDLIVNHIDSQALAEHARSLENFFMHSERISLFISAFPLQYKNEIERQIADLLKMIKIKQMKMGVRATYDQTTTEAHPHEQVQSGSVCREKDLLNELVKTERDLYVEEAKVTLDKESSTFNSARISQLEASVKMLQAEINELKMLNEHERETARTMQAQVQEALHEALGERDPETLSFEVVSQIRAEIESKLGKDFLEDFKRLQESSYWKQSMLNEIDERQQTLEAQLQQTRAKLEELSDQTSPMYAKYTEDQARLRAQQALQTPLTVKAFYNTIDQVLGSYLISAMTLSTNLVLRSQGKKEQAAKGIIKGASSLSQFIPGVGPIASGMLNFGLGKLVGAAANKHYQGQNNNVMQGMGGGLNDVFELSELIARKLAERYRSHIEKEDYTLDECQAAGKRAGLAVYDIFKSGKLSELASVAEKLDHIIDVIDQKAGHTKGKLGGGLFKKSVSPAQFHAWKETQQKQDAQGKKFDFVQKAHQHKVNQAEQGAAQAMQEAAQAMQKAEKAIAGNARLAAQHVALDERLRGVEATRKPSM